MTLKYLLDTNILSEAKRSNPNQNVIEKIRLRQHEIATTLVLQNYG